MIIFRTTSNDNYNQVLNNADMSLNSTVYMSQFGNKFILFLDFNVQLYSSLSYRQML